MGDLPPDRVTPGGPEFASVGVDYFSPIAVKKGREREKRYGCLFTCLSSRAVNIEVVESLETDSVYQLPTAIYSQAKIARAHSL